MELRPKRHKSPENPKNLRNGPKIYQKDPKNEKNAASPKILQKLTSNTKNQPKSQENHQITAKQLKSVTKH